MWWTRIKGNGLERRGPELRCARRGEDAGTPAGWQSLWAAGVLVRTGGAEPSWVACRVQRRVPSGRPEAPGGVQPHRITGAAKRPCRRSADNIPGAPSRGAGKAAASSRDALRVRRASVVTTAKLAKLGSDDALRQHRYVEETPYLRGFSRIGFGQSKSAGKCRRGKERFFDPGSKPFYPSVSASWQQDRTEALSGKDLSFRASRPERIKAV